VNHDKRDPRAGEGVNVAHASRNVAAVSPANGLGKLAVPAGASVPVFLVRHDSGHRAWRVQRVFDLATSCEILNTLQDCGCAKMGRTKKPSVIIVGAGVGGVATAARLKKAGLQVTVVEKNDFTGGRCSLIHRHGYVSAIARNYINKAWD
jgi:threonine dehydrogenase-like Zn-dependent dehydrogenase